MERFWSKVVRLGPDECWEWQAGKDKNGYGRFYWRKENGYAYRVAWELTFGAVPEPLCVLHKCDNPACVNPNHLFLGTKGDNNKDRHSKGRDADITGEKHWSFGKGSPSLRGEGNPSVKLNDARVEWIRTRYAAGNVTHKELAGTLGVTRGLVGLVLNGKVWGHLHAQ